MGLWSDLAVWRGPSPNHRGPMVEQRGLVIHIAQGYFEGTITYENHANPASASSHFVCGDGAKGQGRDGDLAQLLDTNTTAYTQRAGNGHWVSVECAGFVPAALTPAQCESVARLYARGHQVHGWPLQLANSASERGLGHHSMGGTAWGHLDCPGPAIIAQKPAILARAIQIINGGQPAPPEEDDDMRMIVDPTQSVYLLNGQVDPTTGWPVLIPISQTARLSAYRAAGIPLTSQPTNIDWSFYTRGPLPASGGGSGTGPAPGGAVDLTDAAVTKVADAVVDLEHDRLAS
jgi:hypothetical protein